MSNKLHAFFLDTGAGWSYQQRTCDHDQNSTVVVGLRIHREYLVRYLCEG